ncbi:hypothetical protein PENTCL1PPCAC_24076, partial [Pristionchus entomophagus]
RINIDGVLWGVGKWEWDLPAIVYKLFLDVTLTDPSRLTRRLWSSLILLTSSSMCYLNTKCQTPPANVSQIIFEYKRLTKDVDFSHIAERGNTTTIAGVIWTGSAVVISGSGFRRKEVLEVTCYYNEDMVKYDEISVALYCPKTCSRIYNLSAICL